MQAMITACVIVFGLLSVQSLALAGGANQALPAGPAAPPDFSSCEATGLYRSVVKALGRADIAIEVGDYPRAMLLLDAALKDVGSKYYVSSIIDDSGMSVAVAEAEQSKGHLEVAVNLKKRALSSRISAYCWKQSGVNRER